MGKLGLAVVAAVLTAASASAAPQRDALIRMGTGIGKVQLGMTQQQVRRALGGPHDLVYRRADFGASGRYLELGWEFPGPTWSEPITWQVGFRSSRPPFGSRRPGVMRVVRVVANARSQRTPKGVGIGSRPRQIVRMHPHATCVSRYGSPHPGTWVVVTGPRDRMTAFQIAETEAPRAKRTPMFVVAVMVQQRWFSKGGYPYHSSCGRAWENW
jgi:hypothetical protein